MAAPPTYYDAIYLSPHLDDAALSCGGQIAMRTAAGQTVLIVTLMAGDPPPTAVSDFAAALHERWELAASVVADRRAEDVFACHVLGAACRHESLPDAIYRVHPQNGVPYIQSNNDLFGPVHETDAAKTTAQITAVLGALPAYGRLFAPLAIGNHVDHQLVRQAAENVAGDDLWYYEDYPYTRISGALEIVIPAGAAGWYAEHTPLTAAAIQTKIEAIAAFTSQLSSFFNGRADLEAQIRAEAQRVPGERIWQRIIAG